MRDADRHQESGTRKPTVGNIHGRLVAECFSYDLTDTDALLIFLVLHEYAIRFREGVIRGCSDPTTAAALTQRGAGEALGYHWRGTQAPRRSYLYWYERWNGPWGSRWQSEHLPEAEQLALERIVASVRAHPWVVDLAREDA